MTIVKVLPSRQAREQFPSALKRFREEGASAEPLIFGAHREPEAVVIPFALYSELLPAIEELEIARIVRERSASGKSLPLSDLATQLGLDPADYR